MKPMFGFRNTFIYDAEGKPCYKTWSMGAFVDKVAGKLKRVDDTTPFFGRKSTISGQTCLTVFRRCAEC